MDEPEEVFCEETRRNSLTLFVSAKTAVDLQMAALDDARGFFGEDVQLVIRTGWTAMKEGDEYCARLIVDAIGGEM